MDHIICIYIIYIYILLCYYLVQGVPIPEYLLRIAQNSQSTKHHLTVNMRHPFRLTPHQSSRTGSQLPMFSCITRLESDVYANRINKICHRSHFGQITHTSMPSHVKIIPRNHCPGTCPPNRTHQPPTIYPKRAACRF